MTSDLLDIAGPLYQRTTTPLVIPLVDQDGDPLAQASVERIEVSLITVPPANARAAPVTLVNRRDVTSGLDDGVLSVAFGPDDLTLPTLRAPASITVRLSLHILFAGTQEWQRHGETQLVAVSDAHDMTPTPP